MIASLSCQTLISVTDRDVISPLAHREDFLIADGRVAQLGGVKSVGAIGVEDGQCALKDRLD